MAGGLRQEQEPAGTTIDEVASGILRMQLPISMPGLGHVNCYAIPDRRGVTIVDPGLPGEESWRDLLDRLGRADIKLADVHTVVVTHAHPDHFGNAGRLAAEAEADLITHSAFRLLWSANPGDPCEQLSELELYDVDPADLPVGNPFERRTPWGGESFHSQHREMHQRYQQMDERTRAMMTPTPTRRVRDGEIVEAGNTEWVAVHTPGHTIDHLCLFHPESGAFLSGDHVLPTITPHISGISGARDPLGLFVDSLDKVAAMEGVELVLPAHGHPFDDMTGRVDKIKLHHPEGWERRGAAGGGTARATVEEPSKPLFKPQAWGTMADSETFAHLEHLRRVGLAVSHPGPDGKLIFEIRHEPEAATATSTLLGDAAAWSA